MPNDSITTTIIGAIVAILIIVVLIQFSAGPGPPQQDFSEDFYQVWNLTQEILRSQGYQITALQQSQGRISFEKILSPEEASQAIKAKVPAGRIHQSQALGEALVLPIQGGGSRVKLEITEIAVKQEPAPPDLDPSNFFSFLLKYLSNPEEYTELQDASYSSNRQLERSLMSMLSQRLSARSQ